MLTPSSSDGTHPNGVNAVCFALREASNNYLAGSETGVSCPTFLTIFIQSSFAREVLPSFIATTSSCATPDPSHPAFLRVIQGALAACAIHGWSSGASRLYSADLSRSATSPTPAVYRMPLTSSSPIASAFATCGPARLPATLTLASSRVLIFSRLQTFRYVVALQFAHPPARSLRSPHP